MSGYLEAGEDPFQRAKTEIQEELGLTSSQVGLVRSGEILRAFDEQSDTLWMVHPFLFGVHEQNLSLDWEHTESRWVNPDDLRLYETVPKLQEAFERVRWNLQAISPSLSNVLASVDELASDRLHGASFLGRKSIEILAEVARVSSANSVNEVIRDLISVALRLRKAQSSMATIRNLTGRLLHDIEAATQVSASVEQFRETVASLARKLHAAAEEAVEDAARSSVSVLPEEGHVLTHSFSQTVRRALELGVKGGRRLSVCVTESSPGFEGKQLAEDLVRLGFPVRLIADSAVNSIISDVDMVLVGADSVLADGSVINKVGTRKIAMAAHEKGIPFCVVSESAKFSTIHFLGEPVEVEEACFDVTPGKNISKIITESGSMEPREVEQQIRKMLNQLYP